MLEHVKIALTESSLKTLHHSSYKLLRAEFAVLLQESGACSEASDIFPGRRERPPFEKVNVHCLYI